MDFAIDTGLTVPPSGGGVACAHSEEESGALCANDLSRRSGMPMKAIESIVLVPQEWLFLAI
jgi:hypothetical protein